MGDTCIYVVDHRDVEPVKNEPYRLLRVGSNEEASIEKSAYHSISYDSVGENISYKNFAYCELTGLYWIWKNTKHDITGMVHYRRYLVSPETGEPLNTYEIECALEDHECLVPEQIHLGCSVAEHYCSGHIAFDLIALMRVMEEQPEKYRRAFSGVMASDLMIPCNIMIARKEVIDAYCSWLFSVLLECERWIDLYSGRDSYQQRVFGFLAERLMKVWLVANGIDCGYYELKMTGSASDLQDISKGYSLDLMAGINGLSEDQLFDEDFYLKIYDDVARACPPGTPLGHYLADGIYEGRIPSAAYSLTDYANLRPELRSALGKMGPAFFDALSQEVREHKVVLSKNLVLGITKYDKVDYAPVYDWMYYTTRYDDVPDDPFQTEKALRHFVEIGIREGRQGSKGFSLDVFKKRHPLLSRVFRDRNDLYYRWYALGKGRRRRAIDWDYVG